MIAWLGETALAVTLLMVMVLLLRGPVARTFGAGWAYALWAIPALRLVLPPLPQIAGELPLPPVVSFIPTAAEMAAPLPAYAGPGQWLPLALALWAGGAVIFLTLQWLSYRAFLARLDGSSRPARPPLFGGIRTWISEAAPGPLALGLINRRIVLPGDFSRRYSPVERRLALEHELVHHKRGDIWWSLAAMIVLAFFWWNPVAWIAFRSFRVDQELACDAAVARRSTLEERHDYARALVKSASSPGVIAVCALKPADELKRRLRMMRGHRSSPVRSAGGMAAFSILGVGALALGTPEALPTIEAPRISFVAAAPAPAVTAAPIRLASAPAVQPDIVVRGRRNPVLSRAKPALASAPAPVTQSEAPSVSLAALLERLPKAAPAAGAPHRPQATLAAAHGVMQLERQMVRIRTREGEEPHFVLVNSRLSPETEAKVRKAIEHALAQTRAAQAVARHGGGAPATEKNAFTIDIQTIHQGE